MIKRAISLDDSLWERLKWTGIFVMLISLPFSETGKKIGIFFSFLIYLIQVWTKKVGRKLSPMHYGLISLFVSSLLSCLMAADPWKSLSGSNDILFFPAFLGRLHHLSRRGKRPRSFFFFWPASPGWQP